MTFDTEARTLSHHDIDVYTSHGRQLRSIAMRNAFRAMVRRVRGGEQMIGARRARKAN